MKWLFEDFLENSETYRAAQSYWEELVWRAQPYGVSVNDIKLQYVNNEDNDGNPIYSAICLPRELAVRVIEQPVGDAEDLDLDFWIDSVSLTPGAEIKELVISCCLSEENEPKVKRLLRKWFIDGIIEEGSAEASANGIFTQSYVTDNPNEGRMWWERNVSYTPGLCLH